MLRVSFSRAPECVIVVLLESSFSDPRAAQNCCYYYCCYTLQIADFLKGPILLGSNPILGTLKCFPSIHLRSHQPSYSHNIYVEGLLFSRPWVCDRRIVGIELFGPPRGTKLLLLLLLLYIVFHQSIYVRINPVIPTTFMLRVSFSPAPECVIVVLLESSFSDPRAAQNCCYY